MNMKDKKFPSLTNTSTTLGKIARERLKVMFLPKQDPRNTSKGTKSA